MLRKLFVLVSITLVFTGPSGCRRQGTSAAPVPAVSATPTGRIAYVDGSIFYLKTIPDGRPVEISRDAISPEWSPSGEWLSYHFSRPDLSRAFIIRTAVLPGGTMLSLQSSGPTRWSPTADELAFVTERGLQTIRPGLKSGGDKRPFPIEPPDKIIDFRWNVDGRRFAVLITRRGVSQLWDVGTDGTAREIPIREHNPEFHLDGATLAGWTTDGQHILLWPNPGHSASIEADGLALFSVTVNSGLPVRLGADDVLVDADFISISPRTPEILITSGGNRESWTSKRLTFVNPVTGKQSFLTGPQSAVASVIWSPDGKQFAYVLGPDKGAVGGGEEAKIILGQRHIWIMDAAGRHPYQLTNDPQYRDEYPTWSKDGRFILFTRIDKESVVTVWSVEVLKKSLTKLVDPIIDDPRIWFSFYGHVDWPRYLAWSR